MSKLLTEVSKYAKDIYKDEVRLSGEPLFNHVKKIVKKLESIGVSDENTLAVGYLHDIDKIPNFKKMLKDIEKKFGKDVSKLLDQYLSAASAKIDLDTPNKNNINLIVQVFLNMAKDLNILLIVLADKTTNSYSIHALPESKKERSANRGINIYAPLCRFVGLDQFANEIEENCLKILDPRAYTKIKKAMKEKEIVTKIYLKELTDMLEEYLLDNNISTKIYFRIKHPYSIYKKCDRKQKDFGEINDMAALRIIVNEIEDCYKVDALIKQEWKEEVSMRDDYIINPKANGYKSLHAYYYFEKDMPFEVQIRTQEMHEHNEYGQASHLVYKMGDQLKKYNVNDTYWLKEIEFGDKYKSIEFKQFSDFVYTFTPKGDIIELPVGSTVLDFAYFIHDEVGNNCKGAIVNGKIEKLSYKLKNGDKVEIKASTKNNVNMDWLNFAKTYKARKNIRHVLRSKTSA